MNKEKLFFIGLSGVSMRSLALFAHKNGATVFGSDTYPENFNYVGIKNYPQDGHSRIDNTYTRVIYNTAISDQHPDIVMAKTLNIPRTHRAQFMEEITNGYSKLCISGMSGKTSTTLYAISLCNMMNVETNAMVGEPTLDNNAACQFADNKKIILELNEGDMWLHIDTSHTLIMTNIPRLEDHDHIWDFKDQRHMLECYEQLIGYSSNLVYCYDSEILRDLAKKHKNTVSYGLQSGADCLITQRIKHNDHTELHFNFQGKSHVIKHKLIGEFQSLNLLAAMLGVHKEFGVPIEDMLPHTQKLTHANRRLKQVYNYQGKIILQDQAAHPREVEHSLSAIKEIAPNKKIWMFAEVIGSKRICFVEGFAKLADRCDSLAFNKIKHPKLEHLDTDEEIYDYISRAPEILIFSGKGRMCTILDKWLANHPEGVNSCEKLY